MNVWTDFLSCLINDFVSHPLQVEFHDESPDQKPQEYPGIPYKIQLSATAGTRVGLLGVDQSVYILRKREKLNKKRVSNKIVLELHRISIGRFYISYLGLY